MAHRWSARPAVAPITLYLSPILCSMHDRRPLPIPRTFQKEHVRVPQVTRRMHTLKAAGTQCKNFLEGAFCNSAAGDEMQVNFERSMAWCDSDIKQLQLCNEILHQQSWPNISCQHPSMHSVHIQTLLKQICFVSGPGPLQLSSSEGNSPESRLR